MRVYIYTHKILSSQKTEENLAICDNIHAPESIMLTEISQIKKTNTVWYHV